jgi:lysophospholipase L1-like esterase
MYNISPSKSILNKNRIPILRVGNGLNGISPNNGVPFNGNLSAPVLNKLARGTNSVSVDWSAVTGATGYVFEQSTTSGFTSGTTQLYNGLSAGVTREFQPGYTLEYHPTGLTSGTTYYYRAKATAAGYSDSPWSTTLAITTASGAKTVFVAGNTLVANGADPAGWQYYNGSQLIDINAGDTVAVSNPSSGDWLYFDITNVHGTPTEKILIRNDGQLLLTNGFSFTTCSYIDVTGSHASKTDPKGIFISSVGEGICIAILGLSHHMNLDNIKTYGGSYAMRVKNEVNSFLTETNCGERYWWPSHINDIQVSYFDSSEHAQDGFYIGSSGPWANMRPFNCNGVLIGPRPSGLANIHFHHNSMSYCGRSGFQMGCMDLGTNEFHDNTVFECGFEYAVDQGAGMAVGGAVNTINIHNNNIYRTFREPVYSYAYGLFQLHDNTFDQAGTISVDPKRVFVFMEIALNSGQTVSSSWYNSSPGKTIKDDLSEYFFEWFFASPTGNPQVKVQRIDDNQSQTLRTIPTTHPTTVAFNMYKSFINYTVGQPMRIMADANNYFDATVTSWTGGVLTVQSTAHVGSGTYRLWNIYKHTRTPQQAIQDISLVAPGSHAGSQADPFAGFGASSSINASQVTYMTETFIPAGNAVGNFFMNCFSSDPVDVYGIPDGLTRFSIMNNIFGSQKAVSSKVFFFANSTNLYGTGNTICGNTYLGSPVQESNITKPGGNVVTYTLSDSCSGTTAYGYTSYAQENGDNTYTLEWAKNGASLSGTNFTLVGLGSSTLAGTGSAAPNNLPSYINNWISGATSGGTFINMSVGGFDTTNFMTEGNNANVKVYQNVDAAIAHNPDAVFISLPTNDIGAGYTPTQFVNNLKAIYDLLDSYGIPCFVETTQPRDSYSDTQQTDLLTTASLIRSTFPSQFVVDVMELVRDTGSTRPANILPAYAAGDAIHLNASGHTIVFNEFRSKVNAFFTSPSYTEYQIEKSTSSTSGFTLFDTVTGNTVSKSYNRIDGTQYYYRVKGKVGSNYTQYSNVMSMIQPLNVGSLQQTIKFNFGNEVDTAPTTDWNNLVGSTTTQMASGTTFTGITDSSVSATTVFLTITKKFDTAVGNGSTSGSGVYPAQVMRNSWPARGGFNDYSQIKISGLLTGHTYQLEVLTSFGTSSQVELAVRVKNQANKQDFEYSNGYPTSTTANSTKLITLKGLIPNSSGELLVDFIPSVGGGGFVCGMVLKRMS